MRGKAFFGSGCERRETGFGLMLLLWDNFRGRKKIFFIKKTKRLKIISWKDLVYKP